MPTDQVPPPDVLIEFLKREAPIELERLQSIAQVVASGPEHSSRRRDRDGYSHEDWLHLAFGIFGASGAVDSAA